MSPRASIRVSERKMKIGLMLDTAGAGQRYRAVDPANALARRGHAIVAPAPDALGLVPVAKLASCDVVLIYRLLDPAVYDMAKQLQRYGVPIVYDNDDNLGAIPRGSVVHADVGGLRGQWAFANSVKLARLAHTVTVPSAALAEVYRRAGVESVEVIPNMVADNQLRSKGRHDGVVIGWVAALEHQADARELRIAEALETTLRAHPEARVECIGVDLRLDERYRHDRSLPFEDTVRRIGGWDIGLAPLADGPMNHARSDIKVKEYAAIGVPWLASAVGPYAGLGPAQGGRLVADGEWEAALDHLVRSGRERRKLGRRGRRWAASQTADAAAVEWERVLLAAANGAATI